ncbi:MAG: large subunit ribosomal protein L29 [Chlamydiales bacterium]|jgi:large subunit ribosomal protein L29
MAKAQEFRDQSPEELEALYVDLNKKVFVQRNQQSLEKKLDEPHMLRETKKNIARVLTVLREKQLSA